MQAEKGTSDNFSIFNSGGLKDAGQRLKANVNKASEVCALGPSCLTRLNPTVFGRRLGNTGRRPSELSVA